VTTYGCAFGTRHVTLNPIKTPLILDASGQGVFVEVIDKRHPSLKPVVGRVKNAYGIKTASVVADKEVSIWVKDSIVEELKRFGASVIEDRNNLDNKASRITVDVLVCYAQAHMRYGGEVTVALSVKKDTREIIKGKKYTGSKVIPGTNWVASAKSYQKTLELAMEDLLGKLMPDIIMALKT
jgi:hypothetical protein